MRRGETAFFLILANYAGVTVRLHINVSVPV